LDSAGYALVKGTMAASPDWEHDATLPKPPPRAKIKEGDGGDDCISEVRLRFLLQHINPELPRKDWLAKLGAIKDAKTGRGDRTYLEEADKEILADEWSSGVLGGFNPSNYQHYEDVAGQMATLNRRGAIATVGSLVFAAEAAGMDKAKHEELRRAETTGAKALFTPVKKSAANDEGEAAGDTAANCDDDIPYFVNGPDLALEPQIEWIYKDIQAKGDYAVSAGASGSGKTTGENGRIYSLAMGKVAWLERLPEINGPVLRIEAEGQPRSWNDLCAWCEKHGIDPQTTRDKCFFYRTAISLNTPEGERLLMRLLERIKRITGRYPVEVLVDTLRGNMKGSVSDEEDAEGVMAVAKKLQKLGIAFTLIAHHGRATGEIKGLTDWGDLADAVRNYTGRMEIANDTKIEFHKVRYGESRWSMDVTYELRQLKNGQKAVVLVSGKRVGDTSALFKDGANPTETTPATETGRKRRATTDPTRTRMAPCPMS
jgi:hypothetical protein